MNKWKIEIKSIDGNYTTIDVNNDISDVNEMVNELGKGRAGMAFGTGKNETMIFPYATIISVKIKKVGK